MSLLTVTFLLLCLSSLFGAILFLGFTFRRRTIYPLILVISHVMTVVLTFALFSVALIQGIRNPNQPTFSVRFLILTYGLFSLTLATGLFFFVKYDVRRRVLRLRLLASHLLLAALTFISFTSLMALQPTNSQRQRAHEMEFSQGSWYIYHRHHHTGA